MPDGEVTVLKSQFEEFVRVQKSGEVNMLDPVVRVLCCIDRAQHIYIMEHYDELYKKYMEEEKNDV